MIGEAQVIGMNPTLRFGFSSGPGLSCANALAAASGNTSANAATIAAPPTAFNKRRRDAARGNAARNTARSTTPSARNGP